MPTCANGSEPKTGSPTWFTYEQADILSAIPTFGAWIAREVLGLPVGPLNTADFCSDEPVGELPRITDFPTFFIPPLAAWVGAYDRLRNQIIRWKWQNICQCSGTPGGTCYAGWTPTFAFGNLHGSGSNAFTMGYEFHMSTTATIYGVDTWFPNAPNGGTVHVVVWNRSTNSLAYQEDFAYAGSGYRRYLFTTPTSLTNAETYDTYYVLASGTNTLETSTTPATNPLYTSLRPTYDIGTTGHSNTTAGTWQPISPLICTGGPPPGAPSAIPAPPAVTVPTGFPTPPAGPTCASFQDVCNQLSIVYQAVTALQGRIAATQGSVGPTSFRDLTASTGLTGAGVISASAIVGARVVLTSVPSSWGKTSETPRHLIPAVGSLLFYDGASYSQQHLLHYDNEIILSNIPPHNEIAYSLKPGITATITPLGLAY